MLSKSSESKVSLYKLADINHFHSYEEILYNFAKNCPPQSSIIIHDDAVAHWNSWFVDPSYQNKFTDKNFAHLFRIHPLTSALADLNMSNIVVAGGAISKLLIDLSLTSDMKDMKVDIDKNQDVDIFMYGLDTDEHVKNKLNEIRLHLNAKWGTDNLVIYLSNNCISYFNPSTKLQIQVILKKYYQALNVIEDFDMGSCSVMWDGANVLFNARGKQTYETGLNIVDLQYYRHSYETRLSKYFGRKFGLYLPHLNVSPTTDCKTIRNTASINLGSIYMAQNQLHNLKSVNENKLHNLKSMNENKTSSAAMKIPLNIWTTWYLGFDFDNVGQNNPTDTHDHFDKEGDMIQSWEVFYNKVPLFDKAKIAYKNFAICNKMRINKFNFTEGKKSAESDKSAKFAYISGLVFYIENKDFKSFDSIPIRFDGLEEKLTSMPREFLKTVKVIEDREFAQLYLLYIIFGDQEYKEFYTTKLNAMKAGAALCANRIPFFKIKPVSVLKPEDPEVIKLREKAWYGKHYVE